MNEYFRELSTRVAMMLGLGKVTRTQDNGKVQTLQYQTAFEVRDDTYRMSDFGFSSALPAGSDVLIGYLGGSRSNAVIFASNHAGSRHQGLNPGESVLYNQWGLHILMTEKGIVIEANGQDVTINNADKATINAKTEVRINSPLLKVSGDIIDNCESNSSTMKQLRDSYNRHSHVVEQVEPGTGSVTSNATGEKV